jgi:uncharacterized protein YuzE
MTPVVTYDTSADVYYVRLLEGTVARTVEHGDAHLVDLDADGNVVGIEVVLPQEADFAGLTQAFGLEEQSNEIRAAVDAAVTDSASALRTVGTAVQIQPVYKEVTGVVVGTLSHAGRSGGDHVQEIDLVTG